MAIKIFSGPVGSGKTTSLMKIAGRSCNVCGILMPVVEGKRYVYSIQDKKSLLAEAADDEGTDNIVKAGKFRFLKDVFDWGNSIVLNAIESGCGNVIIDEVGPLELTGGGFFECVKKAILFNQKQIVLVVREGLVEHVVEHFNIKKLDVFYDVNELGLK